MAEIAELEQAENYRNLLASAEVTGGFKGSTPISYLGIGASAAQFEDLKKALSQQGFAEGSDYQIRPSSANNGNNVISLSGEAANRLNHFQADQRQQLANKQLLASTPQTNTQKGVYLGVGASPQEFDAVQKAMEQQGFKQGVDYQIKPSSVNGGQNVIALSNESALRIARIQTPQNTAPQNTPAQPPKIDPSAENRKLLGSAPSVATEKGIYLWIGTSAEELDVMQKAMEQQGFKQGVDYNIKPSSLNGGQNVIALSISGATRIADMQLEHQPQQPAKATVQATPPEAVKPVAAAVQSAPAEPTPSNGDRRATLSSEAVAQIQRFNTENRLDESARVAYGYKDGGRQAKYDVDSGQTIIMSQRETITVKDPKDDPHLQRAIDTAKREMAGMTSTAQKANYLNNFVAKMLHEFDPETNEKILSKIAPENGKRREVSLGQLIENGTGVCRHRSLLFKVLADHTGVEAALVRGTFNDGHVSGAHAWNEVKLEDGKRLLVDVMHGHVSGMDDKYARNYYHNGNKQPMYANDGQIINHPNRPSVAAPPAKPATVDIDFSEPAQKPVSLAEAYANNKKLVASTPVLATEKGNYLGVGSTPAEFSQLQEALKQQGLKEGTDYHINKSSTNAGKDVIALTGDGNEKVSAMRAQLNIEPVAAHAVRASATPAAPVAAAAEPAKPARVTPESAMAAASERAREQLAEIGKPAAKPVEASKPSPAKVDIDVSGSGGGGTGTTRISVAAAGAKVDGHSGRAQLAVEVAAEAAKGNYVGAATTAAVAIAEQQGIKFVAKRVPVVGGLITAGMTLWSAGAQAAQGNWKKAGSELAAGAAETVGNVVGFGLGDAAREGARKAMLMAGVKEENAPDKSGIRQAAETAFDMAKTIKNAAQLKSMSKTELAQTIQKDPALPDNVNLKGKQVTLAQAMEDKTFRTTMIKNMEAAAQKDPSMNVRVAALKEYGARLDAADAAKPQTAANKTGVTTAQPAATATASAAKPTPNTAPSATAVVAEAQYKSMTTTQLASAIQKDPTLVDTVRVGGKEVQLADALKDKDFRKDYLAKLEKMDAAGTDMDKQIAMIKAYEVALEKPQPTAPAVQMAQQAPRVNTTPAMA